MIRRRKALAVAVAATSVLALAGCNGKPSQTGSTPKELVFEILPAESQSSMAPLWQPLLDDMSQQLGIKITPKFVNNYTAQVEAMRFNQAQIGWYSAAPALQAVERANAEVLGRVIDEGGDASYESELIVRKGSGITLDDVLKCGKRYNFGIGDAQSTSGTLAPMAYLFTPKGIDPAQCFKTVRAANHQANFLAVANGILDIATNNTVGMERFYKKENPDLYAKVEVIWKSPPLPESAILVRKDLDPAIKEKVRQFFLTYGTGTGPRADAQRKVLHGLTYGGFKPADDSYLDPVREMEAAQALAEARRSGDQARISAAQAAYDKIHAAAAQRRAVNPDV